MEKYSKGMGCGLLILGAVLVWLVALGLAATGINKGVNSQNDALTLFSLIVGLIAGLGPITLYGYTRIRPSIPRTVRFEITALPSQDGSSSASSVRILASNSSDDVQAVVSSLISLLM